MVSLLQESFLKNLDVADATLEEICGQLVLTVPVQSWLSVAQELRDDPDWSFEQLIDVVGMDYSTYKNMDQPGPRFAVIYQLLSLKHNRRLRVKVFAEDSEWPMIPSVVEIWSSANWTEREAYDLFGILFEGHPDLRRILTDYGFVGHPFRKDFPLSGHVEMRYDPEQKRVIYQPVTIEPRETTPRVVREAPYARPIQ